MPSATSDLHQFLEQLAHTARPGDRLPPIRELMRRFGVSQMVVQRAFQALKARGVIDAQVGRGTSFVTPGSGSANSPPATGIASSRSARVDGARTVLLLRRSISILRGRLLVETLQRRFAAEGHRVLEVSYTDPDHARSVLKSLPRFNACVVQSTYKTLTLDALAAVREKCDVMAIDGTALVGADIDAVGTEWGEPLTVAVDLLVKQGHQRIAYASTAEPFLASALGRRRLEALQKSRADITLTRIDVPRLPDEQYESALTDHLKGRLDADGHLPFTALIAWGIEDGAAFRAMLTALGLSVPTMLSVVLLGRTDLPNEHAEFFETVGCSLADQADGLYGAITARWADASRPYGVHLIPVTHRAGNSVAAPNVSAPAGVSSSLA